MDESKKKDRYEDAKKFVRYSDGAKMYSMGMTKFQEVAKDAKACYKIGQLVLVNTEILDKARLKRSYMVMQDVNYELFAESVGAECSFGIRNPDQDLVEETMKELGLTAYRERHPNTLSGGQKQRVAVAVSMICGKDLLVFDEPTSGLDFDSMAQVAGLIKRLSEQGKIIFIVTHDFEFVCRTCSRVLHFDEGEMPDDIPVVMDSLQKLRELFSVSERKEM